MNRDDAMLIPWNVELREKQNKRSVKCVACLISYTVLDATIDTFELIIIKINWNYFFRTTHDFLITPSRY